MKETSYTRLSFKSIWKDIRSYVESNSEENKIEGFSIKEVLSYKIFSSKGDYTSDCFRFSSITHFVSYEI